MFSSFNSWAKRLSQLHTENDPHLINIRYNSALCMKLWMHFSNTKKHLLFSYVILAWALVLVTTARKSSWSTGGMSSTNTASPVACLMADWCMIGCPTGSCRDWLGSTHWEWTKQNIWHQRFLWPKNWVCYVWVTNMSRKTTGNRYPLLWVKVNKYTLSGMVWDKFWM